MEIKLRDARVEDIVFLLSCHWPGTDATELQMYRDHRFDESGNRKNWQTGYPETVWIAESEDGKNLGYLHFFTDCWDGYQDTILALVVDPKLSHAERKLVEGMLETALREREP